MIMMMPLMLMLMICADGSLPALRWLRLEANVDRESYGYRREEVLEGMWNLLATRPTRRSWGWED